MPAMIIKLRNYSFILLFLHVQFSWAIDIRFSLGISPDFSETLNEQASSKGIFKLVNSVISEIENNSGVGTISVKLYPFARSVDNVIKGRADIHFPMLRVKNVSIDELPFTFVSQSLKRAVFVLYTSIDKPILNMDRLEQYSLSTQRGHQHIFPFVVSENDNVRQGFEKIVRDRADGYIVAQDLGDSYIKKHKLKNIRRTFYVYGDAGFIIRKDMDQQVLDAIVSKALIELKDSGRLAQLTSEPSQEYVDWQPAEMPW